MAHTKAIKTGVAQLDEILGGLFIGDNVVWHDDAGSLASVFCLNFIRASLSQGRPLIYVSFDRSPRNLIEKLGELAENKQLTIFDCFTWGKGAGSDVFLRFYEERGLDTACNIVQVRDPADVLSFTKAFYDLHSAMKGDVRFIFESITGMQELWGGEDKMAAFYTHSCPRLYELNTVAYWILEKGAHSQRLKAQINQIAQVVIDLSVKRGNTFLTVVKAEKREIADFNRPIGYRSKGLTVAFDDTGKSGRRGDLGARLRELRTRRGLSQTELARLVGVTPSTISQVEADLIYPSLPALLKMAETLSVDLNSLFQEAPGASRRVIFKGRDAAGVRFRHISEDLLRARMLTPLDLEAKASVYLLEIPQGKSLPSHFLLHKGEELGYLLEGELRVRFSNESHILEAGDIIYLTSETPSEWMNEGKKTATLLWLTIR